MRPAANTNSGSNVKAPLKAERGPSVRLPIKKTYCNKCHKLVSGQKQISGSTTRIICPKCNQQLWVWNSLIWRSVKSGANASA
jgi:RNase P subunit RPR2